jgi:threonine dehydrogenase-like Zn-dependent dehydrogenase
VRFEEHEMPKIVRPPDAIIRISAACVCGPDLRPYRGIQKVEQPIPMGHEYCGIVEEIGNAVRSIKPGQLSSVRHYLPELIDLVWKGRINPGRVFDLTLPLDQGNNADWCDRLAGCATASRRRV